MSPEQVEGREVGAASDIFSLGAVLAFAATGQAPFGRGSAPTLAFRAVYRQVNLDHVPAEVRGLIERCLAKNPGERPAARDLMFAAGAGAMPAPTERWAPVPVTRTAAAVPAGRGGSRTVTSARLSPVSGPAPGRPRRPRGRRPLAIASVVAGILAASAAGGVALAGCTSQNVGVHSVSSPITSAPATSAPSTSPTAIASPSASVTPTASATATPSASVSAIPTASTTGTPTASPTATATGSPTATPTVTATATATATPTAIMTGTPGAGSSPTAAPAAS